MTYNLTAINSSGMVPLMQGVNSILMYDYLGIFILLTFGAILLTSFFAYTRDPKSSFGFTSLICAVIVIFLRNFELVTDTTVFVTWVIAAIMAFVTIIMPD